MLVQQANILVEGEGAAMYGIMYVQHDCIPRAHMYVRVEDNCTAVVMNIGTNSRCITDVSFVDEIKIEKNQS